MRKCKGCGIEKANTEFNTELCVFCLECQAKKENKRKLERQQIDAINPPRVCIRCQEEQPASMFYVSNGVITNLCRKCKNEGNKRYKIKLRRKVLQHYGGKCVCCGESEEKFLSIDHKNNDGNKWRKKNRLSSFYKWIIDNNFPDDLQILCYSCNNAKSLYGICPHQEKKMGYKKFNQDLFDQNDEFAKQEGISYFSSKFGFRVERNPRQFEIDLLCYKDDKFLFGIECAVRYKWDSFRFPWPTVHVEERKAKYFNTNQEAYYFAINEIATAGVIINGKDIISSTKIIQDNKYADNEPFFDVPKDKATFVRLK